MPVRKMQVLLSLLLVMAIVLGTVGCGTGKETPTLVPPTPPPGAMEALETGSHLVAPVDQEQIETNSEGVEYIRGRLTVAFAFSVSVADVKSLLEEYDLKLVSWLAEVSVGEVEYNKGEDLEQLKQELLQEPIIEEVQVSTVLEGEGILIEDDMLVEQFEYLNPLRARLGWTITKGKSEIRVAIIDTGVAEEHPDLRDNIVGTYYNTNQYADISCYDDTHHGTLVAGVVGASDGDGGISGVAPDISLVILKTPHTILALAEAIIWATNFFDARVINISRGGYTSYNNNAGLRRAVEFAYDHNVVLVASAGNGRKDVADDGWEVVDADGGIHLFGVHYPSSYTRVLAVGATDWNDDRVEDSNYGGDVIYAPGCKILTTSGQSSHDYAYGTSVAAPQVAALAALILSVNDKLTNKEVIDLIKSTADLIEAGGLGRINVYRALTKLTTGEDPGTDALPECPTDLRATLDRDHAGQGVVQLTWNLPPTDYSGANIYRYEPGVGRLEILNDSPISGAAYDDKTAEEGCQYRYYVYSVDSIGQESVLGASESIFVEFHSVTPTPTPPAIAATYKTDEDNANNAGDHIADNDLDDYLYRDDLQAPIEFYIENDIPLGSIETATLTLYAWDVDDYRRVTDGEKDMVYFNNHYVGDLTGANDEWSTSHFTIEPSWVKLGNNNLVKVTIDELMGGDWAVKIDWGMLVINGGAVGNAQVTFLGSDKASYEPGEAITVTTEVDTALISQEVKLESNLIAPSGVILTGKSVTYTTYGSDEDPKTVSLAIPSTAEGGQYTVEAIVYDAATMTREDAKRITIDVIGATATPTPITMESSKGSIAAFAENWSWSKSRNQDGKYGETKVSLDLGGRTVETATLYLTAAYSQQSGSASGVVYISSTQQVQPTDANHDKGNYWYGNSISAGTQAGSFTCSYTASTSSFDITDFLKNNPSAGTFYVAVENKAAADIGISSISIKATVR